MMIFTGWSTASFGETPVGSQPELSALGEHLHLCQGLRGRLFVVHCYAEAVLGFLAGRFMTFWLLIGLMVGALVWVL